MTTLEDPFRGQYSLPEMPSSEIGSPESAVADAESLSTDHHINHYLSLYTKFLEGPNSTCSYNLHTNETTGATCQIIMSFNRPDLLYTIEFSYRQDHTRQKYYRLPNGDMHVDENGSHIGTQDPATLLANLQLFFGDIV